jgi:dihydroflavonol-4-reductase
MSATVLVTGATGFLGRNVLDAIAHLLPDVRPVALVRDRAVFLRGRESTGGDTSVDAVEGRLEDADRWGEDPALARCVGILHLAALVRHSRADAAAVFRANVGGTQEMVRLAARLGCRLVVISSSGTVGCSADPAFAPDEEAPLADRTVGDWPYYASKVAAERAASALASVLDVELVLMRPPVLLGPGDAAGRSTAVLRRMMRSRPIIVSGGYHFADVRDVARAIVQALRHPAPRAVYHLPGWNGTLAEFAQLVAAVRGHRSRPLRVPARAAHVAARLLHPLGRFVDPVLVEMARHHWNVRSRYSARDLDYRSRDPQVTVRDAMRWMEAAERATAGSRAPTGRVPHGCATRAS